MAVVVVTAVAVAAVIAITIVTNANPAGKILGAASTAARRIEEQLLRLLIRVIHVIASLIYLSRFWCDLQTSASRASHYFNHILLAGFHFSQRVV